MTGIPQSVKARLAAEAMAGPHPEANILTAFAEQALSKRERREVLGHLGECGECREVLTLAGVGDAFGAVVAEEVVQSGNRPWFGWPTLRWAGLAATIVIAVGLFWPRFTGNTEFKSHMAAPASKMAVSQVVQEGFPTRGQALVISRARVPIAAAPAGSGPSGHSKPVLRPTGEIRAESKAAEVVSSLSAGPATGSFNSRLSAAKSPVPPDSASTGAQAVPPRTAVGGNRAISPLAAQPSKEMQSPAVSLAAANPDVRWALASEGVLLRSKDGGKSWEPVPLKAGTGRIFAIAPQGLSIWAGGEGGQLLHSEDGGEQWSYVQPAQGEVALTGAIVRIEFRDALNGTLVSDTGEIWTTGNGGLDWQKR